MLGQWRVSWSWLCHHSVTVRNRFTHKVTSQCSNVNLPVVAHLSGYFYDHVIDVRMGQQDWSHLMHLLMFTLQIGNSLWSHVDDRRVHISTVIVTFKKGKRQIRASHLAWMFPRLPPHVCLFVRKHPYVFIHSLMSSSSLLFLVVFFFYSPAVCCQPVFRHLFCH